MKPLPSLLALAVLAVLSAPAQAEVGLDVIGGSEITFEGLLQADYYKYDSDFLNLGVTSGASLGDGADTDFGTRRAELVLKGKGPGMWNWVVGYDARADKFLDTNISYRFSGYTTVRVGQYKQPNSLEELGSTKNNDFISKAMTTNLQGVARRVGIAASTGADNWSITGSAFTRELTRNLGEGNGYGGRGTWAPILDAEGRTFLHLGLSYVDYEARDAGSAVGATPAFDGDNRARFRVRPDADLTGTRLVDSGQFVDADRIATLGLEGAFVTGPFKAQAEYMKTNASRNVNADFDFDSWYISGVWNITGETWGYKDGVIVTTLPGEPGSGMWQVAARYDHVDLNDGSLVVTSVPLPTPTTITTVAGVLGGEESNWTLGVNYYWRSNFKFALNYVKVDSEKYNTSLKRYVEDNPSILEFRAQLYW